MKITKKIICILFLMMVCILMVSCGKEKDPHAVTHATKKYSLPKPGDTYTVIGRVMGLQKFAVKYDDNLYRGGMITSEEGAETLKGWGIKTIISITPDEQERMLAKKYGIDLVEIEFEKKPLPKETLDLFVKTLDEKKGPFYIHCHGGTHRGGTLGLAYRLIKQDWDYDKGVKEFEALGGTKEKDVQMITSVKKYAENLKNDKKNTQKSKK